MTMLLRNLRSFHILLFILIIGISSAFAQDVRTNILVAKSKINSDEKPSQFSNASESSETPARPTSSVKTAPSLNRVGVQNSDTIALTLDDAIRRTLQNNNNIEVAKSDIRLQETQLRSLRGSYDPVLTVSPTFTRNSSTGNLPTKDFRANSDVSQLIAPGGGSYQVFFNNTRTENSFTQAQLTSGSSGISSSTGTGFYSTSAGISFVQPLFRDFRIDNTRRQIRIQKKRLQQSDADFRRQTIEIIAQVQNAYWDLVFALRDQQNRVANLDLSKENLRQVEAKIEAGAAAPLARAEVNTEVANRESELLIEIPAEIVEKEKAFILGQIQADPKNASKPANILEKMLDGKLKTWMAETVLTEQSMANAAKYPNTTISQALQKAGLTLTKVVRYKVGAQ